MEQKPVKIEYPELHQATGPSIQFDGVTQQGDICYKREIKNEKDQGHYGCGMCDDDEMTSHLAFHNIKAETLAHASNIDYTKEAYAVGVIKQEPPETVEVVSDGDHSLSDRAMNMSPVSLYPHLTTSTRHVPTGDRIKSDPGAMWRCDQKGVIAGAAESNLNVERKHNPLFTQHSDSNIPEESRSLRNNLLKCTFCVFRTADASVLVQHMRTHNGEKPYTCHLCDYRCAQLSDMKVHKRTHSQEKRYSCSYCSYQFKSTYILKVHERIHTGEKRYRCSICPYTACNKAQVILHERIHTGEKPYKCSICSYTASRQYSITSHERTHTTEKPYKCSTCSYTASWQNSIASHERTHTTEKPYKCSICSYTASRQYSITSHERTHTTEKPYKCSICSYTASWQNSITSHERTHTTEKLYKCSICSYTASRQYSITSHERTHTGEKQYDASHKNNADDSWKKSS